MKKHIWLIAVLAGTLGLAACSKNDEVSTPPAAKDAVTAAPEQAPAPAVAKAQAPQVQEQSANNTGKVLSVQQAGGYTYVEVENATGVHWLASAKANIEKGAEVQWGDSAVMKNFNSKALNRTFDEILFVANVVPAGAAVAPEITSGKVKSVFESGGYSYIEVEAENGVLWLAAPVTKLNQGDTVSWSGASTMNNFHSKTLNRTFESILFVSRVAVNTPAG